MENDPLLTPPPQRYGIFHMFRHYFFLKASLRFKPKSLNTDTDTKYACLTLGKTSCKKFVNGLDPKDISNTKDQYFKLHFGRCQRCNNCGSAKLCKLKNHKLNKAKKKCICDLKCARDNINDCLKKDTYYHRYKCHKPKKRDCDKLNKNPKPKTCVRENGKIKCIESWTGSWKVVNGKCIHYEPSFGSQW